MICLATTAAMTGFILGHIYGLGIGTVLAAFTMGKGIAIVGNAMDNTKRTIYMPVGSDGNRASTLLAASEIRNVLIAVGDACR